MNLIKRNVRPLSVFSNVFDGFFRDDFLTDFAPMISPPMVSPSVNISEAKDHYKIQVAAPGQSKDIFKINVEDDLLTLSAEIKQENTTDDENYTRKEFGFASFKRTFSLPKTVDASKVTAKYEDGILNIVIPKSEQAKEVKEIKIS
ncbi:MAG: Hsp20/alpha crystallin family protein [Bacteroidetes bacterium]|nr:Hsp20/alpha crystallin family protein [Bacteroidota bacterium]